jgi:carbon storage regulator CsrA
MLVLTRKQSETIQIGDSITITVLRMKGKSVRLGIQAPRDFNVIRGELAFEQADDNVSATQSDETEEAESPVKTKSRAHNFRQDSWPAKSAQPAEPNVSCLAGAWSI